MHLFNAEGQIVKYESPVDVLKARPRPSVDSRPCGPISRPNRQADTSHTYPSSPHFHQSPLPNTHKQEFYPIRLDLYEKRRAALLERLDREWRRLDNKVCVIYVCIDIYSCICISLSICRSESASETDRQTMTLSFSLLSQGASPC